MEAAETDISRPKPVALFMAFGTQGDVYPIAAIAAAFACDEELRHYHVVLMTHSAHKNLIAYLAARNVEFLAVTTPPVLSPFEGDDPAGTVKPVFSMQKRRITKEHRQECISNVEQIFGDGPSLEDDFIVINFFALEGWSLAELFHVRCFVAAPYVVPYSQNMVERFSAPSSFERYFKKELPLLYKYLQEAPNDKVGWKDVIHWLWPFFTEDWGIWRSVNLKLSAWPFTDPVTSLPMWHDRPQSPLLLYGFSKEVVECPGYWPPNVRVSGFWFLPLEWQLSCNKCAEVSTLMSSEHNTELDHTCPAHAELISFSRIPLTSPPVFIGLSSVGSMGFLRNPRAFLGVLRTVVEITSHRFILISAGFEPLNAAIHDIAVASSGSEHKKLSEEAASLFSGRVFCFSGFIPYKWLFPRCAAAVHHGGSGSTAAALHAGIPQVICPFMLDQFYWAERMYWLGVAPEPLKRNHLVPEETDDASTVEAANKLAKAIDVALSSKVKARASEVAERLAVEDGVSEALNILKEEINSSNPE